MPALSAPKTEREAVQLTARREAADTVMKIYVQAMHKALGLSLIHICEQHPAFPLFPAGEYGTMKLRPIRYTAEMCIRDRTWKEGKKYLQVSTDEVYGALGAEGYFMETTPLCPHSPYRCV